MSRRREAQRARRGATRARSSNGSAGVFAPTSRPAPRSSSPAPESSRCRATSQRVLTESDLCTIAGLPDLETLRSQYYAARDLRGMYPRLRDDHLRYLEKWGLDSAGRRAVFLRRSPRRQAGGGGDRRGRGAAGAAAGAGADSAGPARVRLSAAARASASPARVVSLPVPAPPAEMTLFPSPRAQQCGGQSRPGREVLPRRRRARRRRGARSGRRPRPRTAGRRCSIRSSCRRVVNLANIHYERDELVEAEALYEKAIRVDRRLLRGVLQPGQHPPRSRPLHRGACARIAKRSTINPAYPEAHFYLAVTLEKLGRSRPRRGRTGASTAQLAPDGEFVELAKEFSD